MPMLRIWKSNLERARDRADLTPQQRQEINDWLADKTGELTLDIDELPHRLARALLDDGKLKPNERAILALRILGIKADDVRNAQLLETTVGGPIEFASILLASNPLQPNAEMHWNGRWYPVLVSAQLSEEDKVAKYATATVDLGLGSQVLHYAVPVNPAWFLDANGRMRDRTVLEVLALLGFRSIQTDAAAYNLRLVAAERLAGEAGKQMLVHGAVMELGRAWLGTVLAELPLGAPDNPKRAVVEPVLQDNDERSYYSGRARSAFDEKVSRLPLVRIFSLETKRYVYADVDDLVEYEYDSGAISRLALPAEMKSVLESVFSASRHDLFGDHVRTKHGGVVILACGHPGIGKTLTAEVYAELTQRPLYVLEFGELGTTVEAIENNLATVFGRVVKWRAVLQFDECEVFLAKRGEDLNRSAIVGIFLRMLDYYEGLLFLTTNRPEVLDHAVHSRVMLRLNYPDLTEETRASIWRIMLKAAGMQISDSEIIDVARENLNGRQIRNRVRLARILFGTSTVTAEQIKSLRRYSSQVD